MLDEFNKLLANQDFINSFSSVLAVVTSLVAITTFSQYFRTIKKRTKDFLSTEYYGNPKEENLVDDEDGQEANKSEPFNQNYYKNLLKDIQDILEKNNNHNVTERIEAKITEFINLKKTNRIETDNQKDLFETYHAQGLFQSKLSFNFSIGAAVVGFGVILLGILNSKNYTAIVSGAVIDAVAGLFFVQSNKSRALMTEFFDKLREDKKFHESLKLADEITDDELKSKLKAFLSINFAGLDISDANLNILINISKKEEKPE